MPRLNIEIWLTDQELSEFKSQFEEVSDDPDTPYGKNELCDWIGDKLLEKWRRKPIKES